MATIFCRSDVRIHLSKIYFEGWRWSDSHSLARESMLLILDSLDIVCCLRKYGPDQRYMWRCYAFGPTDVLLTSFVRVDPMYLWVSADAATFCSVWLSVVVRHLSKKVHGSCFLICHPLRGFFLRYLTSPLLPLLLPFILSGACQLCWLPWLSLN